MKSPEDIELPPPSMEPGHAVSGYLAKHGVMGLLNLHKMDPERYESSVTGGHKHVDKHADALFSGEILPSADHSKSRKLVDDWINKGGIDNDVQQEIYEQNAPVQNFAEGGEVRNKSSLHNQTISESHPHHNMMLQTAKGRVSSYLNSQRPQEHLPKLAFDPEPDQSAQKKSYEKARDIAIHPMSIMHHMKKGTLEPEQLRHFNAMYPELGEHLQKKLTEKIVQAQLDGKKPSYAVRQGLSMIMGAPLSGEMLPQNIQAAQATFKTMQQPASQGEPPTKMKKNTAPLSKSDQSFLTGNQARAERQQKQ